MTNEEFLKMRESLMGSIRRFPDCPIANCECAHKSAGEWRKGCYCLCHMRQMDAGVGSGWTLDDLARSAKAGKPRKANDKKTR